MKFSIFISYISIFFYLNKLTNRRTNLKRKSLKIRINNLKVMIINIIISNSPSFILNPSIVKLKTISYHLD